MVLAILLFLGSAVAIYLSCELFVNGVEWLGRRLSVTQTATGTILAAVGTALPESVVTFVAVALGDTLREAIAEATDLQHDRPSDLRRALSNCAERPKRPQNCRACNRDPLASVWLPAVLAMEIAMPARPAAGPLGNSPIDPRDEHGQFAVGRATHSRRTAQARDRRRTNLGRQIYGETQKTAFARMEDLSAQPCRRDRGNGPVRRSDSFLPIALWLIDYAARPSEDIVVRRDRASHCGMDRQPAYRSLRLGTAAAISHSRP